MCFGLLCVSLVASVLVMQIQMKAERDVKSSDMLHEFNGTLNLMQMSYSQQTNVTGHLENDCREEREFKLTTEKDQLQNRFNTIEAELKKRNLERGYHVSNEKKNWADSRQVCRDRGGDLVVINSAEEQMFISSLVKENVWIGLSDVDSEGHMKWVNNERPNVNFWHPGEPNNVHGQEDCVELEYFFPPDKNWNDQVCAVERRWICEN